MLKSKTVYVLVLLGIFLILTGCSMNSKNKSVDHASYYTHSKVEEIKSNRARWEHKVSQAEFHKSPKYVENPPAEDTALKSVKAFQKKNIILVQGTVMNLQTANQSVIPSTKIIIHVDKALSGSKQILNHNVKFFTEGGLIPKNNYMSPDGQSPEYDGKTVYDEVSRYPLPKIGNKVVISLEKGKTNFNERKDKLKHYDPRDVEEEYWIYDSKSKKYVINNELIKNLNSDEKKKFNTLFKLTKDINESI